MLFTCGLIVSSVMRRHHLSYVMEKEAGCMCVELAQSFQLQYNN